MTKLWTSTWAVLVFLLILTGVRYLDPGPVQRLRLLNFDGYQYLLKETVSENIVLYDIDEAFLLGDQVVILEKGARIAQKGSPEEILANPASDFVASFIGADRGKRALSIREVDGSSILVDGDGNVAGALTEEGTA